MHKLILPINKAVVTASVDTTAYRNTYGSTHCGIDLISAAGSATLYGSGEGTVVATGRDDVVGNVVIVHYPGAWHHGDEKAYDVVFRYFHLSSIAVKKGEAVTKDTRLGNYGATGRYVDGAHLHLEADLDIKNPLYSPTLRSGTFLKGTGQGAYAWTDKRNTCINPVHFLHCKASSPDNQTWTTRSNAFIRSEDKSIPIIW